MLRQRQGPRQFKWPLILTTWNARALFFTTPLPFASPSLLFSDGPFPPGSIAAAQGPRGSSLEMKDFLCQQYDRSVRALRIIACKCRQEAPAPSIKGLNISEIGPTQINVREVVQGGAIQAR
eukprot:5846359-Pyramimonas_sp.AAC.1